MPCGGDVIEFFAFAVAELEQTSRIRAFEFPAVTDVDASFLGKAGARVMFADRAADASFRKESAYRTIGRGYFDPTSVRTDSPNGDRIAERAVSETFVAVSFRVVTAGNQRKGRG